VSKDTFVIVDEAYYEYVLNKEYPNSLKIQMDYPNLIVMRSFSKIYGLAGLRVGYTIASKEIIEKMEHFQAPFTVNHLASIACIAALSDDEFVRKSRLYNNEGRFFLQNTFTSLGYKIVQSESNFLFIYFETKEERDSIFDLFEKHHIIVRKTDYFGAKNAFRITIGTPELNAEIIECINNLIQNK
jgi:histidinol-phosphate aminotransferase